MKFLSSSSSSTATTSDSGSYIYRDASSGGLIGMLRCLLCFNTLPKHRFDHIADLNNEAKRGGGELNYGKGEIKFEEKGNPGIVARLMGLDSMPELDCHHIQTRSASSITRSQSMNYADTRREESLQEKHHQTERAFSFREAPSFVEMETDEFFILSFEGGGKDNDLLLKTRKYDTDFQELKPRREKCRKMNKKSENDKENIAPGDVRGSKVHDSSTILLTRSKLNENSDVAGEVMKQPKPNPICQRQSSERRQLRQKKKENCSPVQKVEIQSDSDNSSPVSVLDYGNSPLEQEVPSSDEDSNSSSRRTLSGKLEIYTHSSSLITNNLTRMKKQRKGKQKVPICGRIMVVNFKIMQRCGKKGAN